MMIQYYAVRSVEAIPAKKRRGVEPAIWYKEFQDWLALGVEERKRTNRHWMVGEAIGHSLISVSAIDQRIYRGRAQKTSRSSTKAIFSFEQGGWRYRITCGD